MHTSQDNEDKLQDLCEARHFNREELGQYGIRDGTDLQKPLCAFTSGEAQEVALATEKAWAVEWGYGIETLQSRQLDVPVDG